MGLGAGAFFQFHLPWLTEEWWEQVCFNLRATVQGVGLGRSLEELYAMPSDHLMRDHERLIELRDRVAQATRGG